MTDSPATEPAAHDEDIAFDPMDSTRSKDWTLLGRIQQEHRLARPAPGLVMTTRHADTGSAFRDAKRFSSVGDMRAPGVTVSEEESFLGELDAPLHPKIRRILHRGFTPQGAEAAEPWTRANVRRRLGAIREAGSGDLMRSMAVPLPGSVAAHVLGIPDEHHDPVMGWCLELLHSTWPALGRTERGEGIAGAFPELTEVLDGLIAERRTTAAGETPDLLAVMVQTEVDGWRIPEQHVRTLAVNILAGSLSASYMIGNLLYRYLTDEPGFAARLRGDRSLLPVAVEETLRNEAPVPFLFRTAREDSEIGGCPVARGEHVMLSMSLAGRDDTVYDDAWDFSLDRDQPAEHLAFGLGPHLCLGNHLTRMVGRVVLEEVLDTFAAGELSLVDDFEWVCVANPFEYGPERLDVVLAPTA